MIYILVDEIKSNSFPPTIRHVFEVAFVFTVSFTDLDQNRGWLFLSRFKPLLKKTSFFEEATAVAKIGSSLKSIRHIQI